MRTSTWAYTLLGVLTCSVAYSQFNQPLLQAGSLAASEQSERRPLNQTPEQPLGYKDQARLQDTDTTSAGSKGDRLPIVRKEARLEDATSPTEPSEPNEKKQDLSYLAYYAYSELPPETKPADIVLKSLKGIPPGTPVDEIKSVSSVLGLDFTFMKAVAKIESGFDPKQRTGSYIGLFQLSKKEFEKYGSGDILAPRDNTVAAALKFMIEGILFETFTNRKPTLNDLYLIHQQLVDGASEHVSNP